MSERDVKKALERMELKTEFTKPTEMAICLYYDLNQKHITELMIIHPSKLTPCDGPDIESLKGIARDSPLINTGTLTHLLNYLEHDTGAQKASHAITS